MRVSIAVVIGLVGACTSNREPPTREPPRAPGERIVVPTIGRGNGDGRPAPPPAPGRMFALTPDEGALTIEHATTTVGTEATARIAVTPAAGFKVSTDYRTKLELQAPAGVRLAKAQLRAGGLDADPGDAETFGERKLAFAVKATAEQPGRYTITGSFHFGMCDRGSCHEKHEPVSVELVVN